MNRVLREIVDSKLTACSDEDKVRVSLRNMELDNDIYTTFRKKKDFSVDLLMNEIIKVSQSKKEFLLNGMIELNIICVKVPTIGGGGGRYSSVSSFCNIDKWRKKSNKVVQVKGDGLCLARAIVVSKAHADGKRGNKWRQIREDRYQYSEKIGY